MKAVILAGGLGTRISEETHARPKPMVEVGARPLLWHVMKIYSAHGVTEFIVCCGYKGYVIKEYFSNYFLHMSDVTFDMAAGAMHVHERHAEPWKVTLVDTGDTTNTGGRLARVARYLEGEEAFHFTYGDGVADVDVTALTAFHRAHGRAATVTSVTPPGRYGALKLDGDRVAGFTEKPEGDGLGQGGDVGQINGGFFVLSPDLLSRIPSDSASWETDVLPGIASDGELMRFAHGGYWQAMDTLREKNQLEALWASGDAPWKVW